MKQRLRQALMALEGIAIETAWVVAACLFGLVVAMISLALV